MVSIDDYFTDQSGKYEFRFDENHIAYKQCIEATGKCLAEAIKKVIVHNTFTMDWEMEPYIKMAARYNYFLFVATVENYHSQNNIHGISREQIEKMAAKFKVKLY